MHRAGNLIQQSYCNNNESNKPRGKADKGGWGFRLLRLKTHREVGTKETNMLFDAREAIERGEGERRGNKENMSSPFFWSR